MGTSYEGHQVLSVTPRTREQVQLLREWMMGDLGLDFWEEPGRVGSRAVFMAPPSVLDRVKADLERENIEYNVDNDNVQRDLDEMWADIDKRAKERSVNQAFNYDDFNTFDDIMTEIETLRSVCGQQGLQCQTYSIGQSYEGRDIT